MTYTLLITVTTAGESIAYPATTGLTGDELIEAKAKAKAKVEAGDHIEFKTL